MLILYNKDKSKIELSLVSLHEVVLRSSGTCGEGLLSSSFVDGQPAEGGMYCIAAIGVLMSLILSFSAISMAPSKEQSVCVCRQLDKPVPMPDIRLTLI